MVFNLNAMGENFSLKITADHTGIWKNCGLVWYGTIVTISMWHCCAEAWSGWESEAVRLRCVVGSTAALLLMIECGCHLVWAVSFIRWYDLLTIDNYGYLPFKERPEGGVTLIGLYLFQGWLTRSRHTWNDINKHTLQIV